MKNLEKMNVSTDEMMLNLRANFDELEKQLTSTRNTFTQLVKQKKRGKRNGEIVKGKVYVRTEDYSRDTTERLEVMYRKSKIYVSKKAEIYEALKKRRINYEKKKVKDEACKRRMKLIDKLIVDVELFGL